MPVGKDASSRMSVSKPPLDEGAREETSRVQNLSSVAPPPVQDESIDATYDVTTYIPAENRSQPLRMLGWAMVIGGATALALVLIIPKLRSQPVAQPAVVPPAPVVAVAPQAVQVQEAPPANAEPTTTKGRRGKRAAAVAAPAEANLMSIRIRARVAPVRAAPEADARVVCSVKRGAVMRSFQQTQGSKARWFAVHCGKDTPGWVHENFLTPVRP